MGGSAWSNQIVSRLIIAGPPPTGGSELVYDTSPPAFNHLIASIAGGQGTDPKGNVFLPGITTYRNVSGTFIAANMNPSGVLGGAGGMILIYTAASEAGPWTLQGTLNANSTGQIWLASQDGTAFFVEQAAQYVFAPATGQAQVSIMNGTGQMILKCTTAGVPQVNNGNDTQNYFLGHALQRAGSNILINSTTPITLITFANVNTGYYRVRARILFSSATGTTQSFNPRIAGTCTLDTVELETALMQVPLSGANIVTGQITAQNADPTGNVAVANSLSFRWELEGFVHVSASGTLLLTGRQGTSAANEQFTVGTNTWMEIAPVS